MLGSQDILVAERVVRALDGQEQRLREAQLWPQVTALACGELPALPVGDRLQQACGSAAVALRWRRDGRVVCSMHPELTAQITASTSERFSGAVFARLPYANPLVVFPAPIPVTAPTGEPARVLGFHLYGGTQAPGEQGRRLCGTHDPALRSLGIMAVCEILDSRGGVVDVDLTKISVPAVGRFTIAEATEATLRTYQVDPRSAPLSRDRRSEWVTTMTGLALNVLLYLCSRTPDLEEVGARSRKTGKAKSVRARKDARPRMVRVGWRLGPALTRALAERERRGPTSGTGPAQSPQHRRCHFKTVWTGPGREVPDVAFVLPYWTHRELLDTDTAITVIPVTAD
ncbi:MULTISPECIES: hypothetical protein [Actinosynnema]|uniref:hypothetical protein n=1 Tax=Actinosynnema TaxID=40566 RepID=UPI0020A55D83|nr:hypothetical protein [Actinosynnema pretiosum]MCP2097273.1 hypothetical protein [Actinosynnema pretiosum]